MRLGVANLETWIFLEEIYKHLSNRFETEVFKPAEWPLSLGQRKMSHYLLRRSLADFIRRNEVVFFEWASNLLVEASHLHRPGMAALVTRLHRYEMFQWVERIKWEAVSLAILDTEAMRQKLLARTGMAPERTVVIANAVPLAKTSTAYRPFRGNIGILANLHPRKRIYELILAYHAAQLRVPELTLHIGGPTRPMFEDYAEALQDLCRKLQLTDKVTFYGRVSNRWEWYHDMDVFVSFSYSEGMQVAPIEAAACGCYCLSHAWVGANEIFPCRQIFVTEAEFVQKLVDYARSDDRQRDQMRQPFIEYVSRFCDLERVNHEIEACIWKAHKERVSGV
jgi:glycosyltransferase involved in cell wall biosynthesis